MNVITGLTPKTIQGFKGLFDRGSLQNIPEDHLSFCDNCIFPGQDLVGIREGVDFLSSPSSLLPGEHVISVFPYSLITSTINRTDFLYLTDQGRLIDGSGPTVLGTFTGGFADPDDFSCINYGGRVFISLKALGIAWENASATDSAIHYYDGTIFSPIAGVGPLTAPALSETTAGIVDAGYHTVAVSYLYRDGYISPPGVTAAIHSSGTNNILLTVVPVSLDPNVVGRVILVSKANGNILYFAPGGTINDNVTTLFDFNSPDSALLQSADYLNNVLPIVPNGAALKFYHGRMVIIGPHGVENNILFSNQLSPETFDVVSGAVQIPVDFQALNPNTGIVINDTFYILKPNGTFATQDNGGDPNTWNVTSIDAGLGGFDTSVSNFAGNFTDILDNCLVCTPRGLIMFTGSYQDTPLSFKIDSLWRTINPKVMYLLQIAHDVWNKRVYIAVPLYGSAYNNFILMMDYSEGLTPQNVKWSRWWFQAHPKIPKMIQGVYLITGSGAQNISQQLILCFGDTGFIYTLSQFKSRDEFFTGIFQEVDTAALSVSNGVNVYLMLRLNLQFMGNLQIQAFNLDKSINYSIRGFLNTDTSTPSWVPLTLYTSGQYIYDGNSHFQLCIVGGISGSFAPTWDDSGGVTTEGTGVEWQDTGITPPILTQYYRGVELDRQINIQTEKIILKFANDASQVLSYFTLNRIDLFGKKMWEARPALTQAQ